MGEHYFSDKQVEELIGYPYVDVGKSSGYRSFGV